MTQQEINTAKTIQLIADKTGLSFEESSKQLQDLMEGMLKELENGILS